MPANVSRRALTGAALVGLLCLGPLLLHYLLTGRGSDDSKTPDPAPTRSSAPDLASSGEGSSDSDESIELNAGPLDPEDEPGRAALFFSVTNKSDAAGKVIVQLDAGGKATLAWAGASASARQSQSSCWQSGEYVRCQFDSLKPNQLQAVDVYLKTSEPKLRVKLFVLDTHASTNVDLVAPANA